MKTRVFTFILLALTMISYSSCSSDDPLNEDEGTGGNNGSSNLKTGQVQMKTTPNSKNFVSFYIQAKKVTIDWGDGQVDELTPNNVNKEFKHEYTNQNLQKISIKTEEMIQFTYGYYGGTVGYIGGGWIAELKLGDCPNLEYFSTYYQNKLTVLEFGSCPKLTKRVNITNCPISTLGLNNIFKMLPNTTDGLICYGYNESFESSDISIAEKKGWTFKR